MERTEAVILRALHDVCEPTDLSVFGKESAFARCGAQRLTSTGHIFVGS